MHALAWSPDGTRIAYDGPEGSVYSIDVESGEHTLLVRRPAGMASVEDLDWSPDGAHVAITYGDASQGDSKALYLANADGSDLRLVARIDAGLWPVWHPGLSVGTAWSPDGTRLAYVSRSGPEGDRELQVWTVSANGSAPSLVASRCCVIGGDPVWSPDGSQIAFFTEGGEGGVQLGAIVGPSGRQRRRNGRPAGDRLLHVPELGRRLVLLLLLRVSLLSTCTLGGFRGFITRHDRTDMKGRMSNRWQPPVQRRDDLWSSQSSWSSCPGAPDPPRATGHHGAGHHEPQPPRDQQPRSPSLTS